jgi:hypothetical protein
LSNPTVIFQKIEISERSRGFCAYYHESLVAKIDNQQKTATPPIWLGQLAPEPVRANRESSHHPSGTQPAATMRIILQDRESFLYLKQTNEWTPAVEEATDFQHLTAAMDFVRLVRIPGLDVLMYFGDPRYDVRLRAS